MNIFAKRWSCGINKIAHPTYIPTKQEHNNYYNLEILFYLLNTLFALSFPIPPYPMSISFNNSLYLFVSVAPHKTFVSFSRPPMVYFNLNWTTQLCTYTHIYTFYTRMSVPDSDEVLLLYLYLNAISIPMYLTRVVWLSCGCHPECVCRADEF